jgi:hypothetical protein
MFQRVGVGLAVGCAFALLVGCAARTGSPSAKRVPATAADTGHVTLHVKDMTKRLGLS